MYVYFEVLQQGGLRRLEHGCPGNPQGRQFHAPKALCVAFALYQYHIPCRADLFHLPFAIQPDFSSRSFLPTEFLIGKPLSVCDLNALFVHVWHFHIIHIVVPVMHCLYFAFIFQPFFWQAFFKSVLRKAVPFDSPVPCRSGSPRSFAFQFHSIFVQYFLISG